MAEAKRKAPARKTTAKKTTQKAVESSEAAVQTTTGAQSAPVRVEAGGIDPRLVEQRERQKAEEAGVAPASPREASIDPKLLEIRERTIQRERELAGRSLLKPPARA